MKGEQKHDTFIICMQHRISDLRCAGCKRHLHADQLKDPCGGRRAGKMVPHRGCHTEGVTKMLWGLDLAFFVMYRCSVFPAVLWLAAFLVLTVVIIIMAYKNNGKYLK